MGDSSNLKGSRAGFVTCQLGSILHSDPNDELLIKKFECVSKSWSMLINSSHFIDVHLSRSKENIHNFHIMALKGELDQDEEKLIGVDFNGGQLPHISVGNAELWGSCNGLLFAMLQAPDDCMILWNPSTRECKKLPPPHIKLENHNPYKRCYGFGYNAKTMDYEVVVILLGGGDRHVVQVYSLRNNSWRRLEDISFHIVYRAAGQLVNGKLYWHGESCHVSYDIATEKIKEIPAPMFDPEAHWSTLLSVGECYLYYFEQNNGGLVKAWVMKDDGFRISWTKMIEVQCESLYVMFSTKEGISVILIDNENFVCYDARKGTWNNQVIKCELKLLTGYGHTFTPSLVTLGGGTEKMGNAIASSKRIQSDLSKENGKRHRLLNRGSIMLLAYRHYFLIRLRPKKIL